MNENIWHTLRDSHSMDQWSDESKAELVGKGSAFNPCCGILRSHVVFTQIDLSLKCFENIIDLFVQNLFSQNWKQFYERSQS